MRESIVERTKRGRFLNTPCRVAALSLLLLAQWCGCGTTMNVSLAEYQRWPHGHIENVVLRDGRTMQFDTTGQKAGVVINGMIVGTLPSGEMVYLPMEEVATISYYDARTAQSALLTFGGLLAVSAAIFLLSFGGVGI